MAQLEKFKLSTYVWDSDKDPKGFNIWVENVGSMVRATEHGRALEDMLDSKLRRRPALNQNVPTFILSDPDFEVVQPAAARNDGATAEVDDDDTTSIGSLFTTGEHPLKYSDLSEQTKQLDGLLYNVLRMNVKGSKHSLLASVTFPSYVQAILILDKHMGISKMDRIVRAFSSLDKLTYAGDALKFQTEALGLKRELDLCGANITHYFMCRLMKAFDGKSKTVQFKIASDFNEKVIDSTLNVYDLVQKYCSELASVGDGTPKQVNVIKCHHCNGDHKKSDCPQLKAERQKAAKKKSNAAKKGKKGIICYHCGEEGHIKPECPKAKAEAHAKCQMASGAAGEQSSQSGGSQSADTSRFTPQQLQQVLAAMRGGGNCQMVKAVPKVASVETNECVVLSLCDGIGTMLHVLESLLGVEVTSYYGVELDETARVLSDNLNEPEKSRCGGVNHSWHCDVHNITRQDIQQLGQIHVLAIQAPCQDHSQLRLLPRKGKKDTRSKAEKRPGFKGRQGKVFLKCLEIYSWVMEFNPNCEFIVEHLKFDDMPEDWRLVCAALGQPLIMDSADVSASRRVRAWWTNMQLPESMQEITAGRGPVDANEFMETGRTVEPYMVAGKQTIRTIGSAYIGDPDNPKANTAVPVNVYDVAFEKAQGLRPVEAEQIHGFPPNSTAGRGATAKDRLKAIGNSWDVRVAAMMLRFLQVVHPKQAVLSVSEPVWSSMELDELKQIVTSLVSEGRDADAVLIMAHLGADEQGQLLCALQKAQPSSVCYAGSVLDSGSSKHLSGDTCVTHADDVCSLTGFNNTVSWTDGSGYLPVKLQDAHSNEVVALDFEGADRMDGLASDVLSMGKLIREHWKFYFEGPEECYAVHPSGQFKFKVDLSDDDLLRLPHGIRTGKNSVPVHRSSLVTSKQCSLHVKRTAEALNAEMLHSMFCHRSMEQIYRTLQNTQGYIAVRLPDMFCDVCALIKAKRRGLRSKPLSSLCMSVIPEVDYQDDDSDTDDDVDLEEMQYSAPVAGRSKGVQPVPRFDLEQLRPFEVMFADNKDYDVAVRGGKQVAFVLYDLKTTAKFVVDVQSKAHNGNAFRRIMALNGVHKLPYHCTVYTDGCGSMVHVEIAAVAMGIDHVYIPPFEQSLNEAEKICYFIWDDAAAIMQESKAPEKYFNSAVQFACYADMRSASTASRGYKTPYEMIKGVQPSILKMHRFFTLAFVALPRQKRKQLAKKGFLGRAEQGRLLGFQSIYSSTFKVLLSGNRVVHSINVTFDDTNYVHGLVVQQQQQQLVDGKEEGYFLHQGTAAEQPARSPMPSVNDDQIIPEASGMPQAYVQIEPCDLFDAQPAVAEAEVEFYDVPDGDGTWLWHEQQPLARLRPNYTQMCTQRPPEQKAFLCKVEESLTVSDPDESQELLVLAINSLVNQAKGRGKIDHGAIAEAQQYMTFVAMKDIQWKKALEGEDRDKAIAAFHAERDALLDTVLTLIDPDDSDYAEAKELAVTGRYLLDVRRNGMYKARGVKHGFKEDKSTADGPGFVYYTHLAKLYTFRMSFFRPNRGTRRVAIQDVKTAFLQSDRYPPHIVKYVQMYNPVARMNEVFKQSAPLYGENSAPVRWEDTFAPYLETEGYVRGENERAVFYHPDLDLLNLVYVDDNLLDGEEDSVLMGSYIMEDRFDCKELEWLNPDMAPLDYLGMELLMDATKMYVSMEKYIHLCLESLGWSEEKTARMPMSAAIDPDTVALDTGETNRFHRGLGCLSWLNMTARLDIAQAFSRIGQHQANPTESAMVALKQTFRYLKGTAHFKLSGPIYSEDRDLSEVIIHATENASQCHWEFYCDSDFAGNSEIQNKRRSQNGYVALLNGAPVYWVSKVSSVAFASPLIGEAHADMSSSAAEIYCAGNATIDFLNLSYIASEMNIDFPKPFVLQIDNAAAKIFADDSAYRSKLKHIDCRQEWVKMLRDKDICQCKHVPSADNLADLFTKFLPLPTFERLRERLMETEQ